MPEPPTICTDISEGIIGSVYTLKTRSDQPETISFHIISRMKIADTYQIGLKLYDTGGELIERVTFGLPSNAKQSFDYYFAASIEGYVESDNAGISKFCVFEAGEDA
jgi:hypothetical protein